MAAEAFIKGSSLPSSTQINRSEIGDELLVARLVLLLDLVCEGGDASGTGCAARLLLLLLFSCCYCSRRRQLEHR